MTKKAVVFLAQGFEEIEAITVINVLRRASIDVTVAGVTGTEITASRGTRVVADKPVSAVTADADAYVLPGGMPGATNLAASAAVRTIITQAFAQKKLIAAICASPAVVLAPFGILNGKRATCFPGCEKELRSVATYSTDAVVVDGTIITSRGPATAFAFAFTLVELLAGKDKRQDVEKATLYR